MGAITKGPEAKPRTYTETTKAASSVLRLRNSSISSGTPGAKMDDARGVMNVKALIRPQFTTFCQVGKLYGFAGSSGPSHHTTLASSSDVPKVSTTVSF